MWKERPTFFSPRSFFGTIPSICHSWDPTFLIWCKFRDDLSYEGKNFQQLHSWNARTVQYWFSSGAKSTFYLRRNDDGLCSVSISPSAIFSGFSRMAIDGRLFCNIGKTLDFPTRAPKKIARKQSTDCTGAKWNSNTIHCDDFFSRVIIIWHQIY